MSADNWAECPICNAKLKQFKAKLYDSGIKGFTEEEKEEFDNLKKNLKDCDYTPVREDYEQGVLDNGYAIIIYNGGCQVCGANWHFEKEDILPEDPEDQEFVKKGLK